MTRLFTKYNSIHLPIMILLFVLSGIIYYLLISKVLVDEVDEALASYEEHIAQYVDKNQSFPVFRNFEEVEISYLPIAARMPRNYALVERFEPEEHLPGTYRQLVFTQALKGKLYAVNVAKPLEGTRLLIKSIAYSTLTMLLVIILISLLVNQLILKKLWRPFYLTMTALKGFKIGSQAALVLAESDIEEFSFMNFSISEVIRSAKEDYRILKEFTENASHETQTPLAIIRSKLDLVIQEEGLSAGQSEALQSVYAGIHRLSRLNHSLLLLAKIENHQFAATEQVDMRGKLQEKLVQFHELWEDNALRVQQDLNPATLQANGELVDVLLNNLLSNAVRHSGEHGEISVLLQPGTLRISNTASGAALDFTKLFRRFYKEAQYSRHNGLGLSIVKQICDQSAVTIRYDFSEQKHHFTLFWM